MTNDMYAEKYFQYLINEIHTTVVATNDEQGLPVTCAIDMMLYDENGLYFLTARGKSFYNRLKQNGYLALSGIKGKKTLTCAALSIRGSVREIGSARLPELFAAAPYMRDIYPTAQSCDVLTVFQIYEGTGEWFDLSEKPIKRATFTFGGTKEYAEGYVVNYKCIGCMACYSKCPQMCINIDVKPVVIKSENCLHCGNCFEVCSVGAIEKRTP